MSIRTLRVAVVTAVAALTSLSALADPPARVARVSLATGAVSFRPASSDEWTTATLNYPVTIGDHVWTDAGARTELELGSATARLAPLTEFSVLNLDDRVAQFRITQGAMSVRVRALNPDDVVEVDTPNGAITLVQPGLYRIDVNDAGDATTVTVRRGEADVAAATSLSVRDGQTAVIAGDAAPVVNAAVRMDDFEDWALARDRRDELAQSSPYVSPELIGAADLAQYGSWSDAPEYGAVWVPRVRAEWVPYRFGHWAWVEPWGWTWIDDAPWGFAPFHYGRWVMLPTGWAWIPGHREARPVYAPALVAFVGGNGWRAGAVVGEPVAWFPLGPREVFVPSYRVSPVYVRAINTPHVAVTDVNINVTTVRYVNRDVAGAVTAVPRDVFVRAQPVGAVAVAVPRESVRTAVVVGTSVPIQPQRVVVAAGAAVRVAAPPPAVVARRVIVRQQPPPAANAAERPVVREAVREGARPTATPAPQAAPAAAPAAPAAAAPAAAAPAPAAPATAPRTTPPPAAPAAPPAAPRAVQPPPPPAAARAPAADLVARHNEERAAVDARHAAERAALQAKHQQEQQHATAAEKPQLQQKHQAEMKALQDRHKQERDALVQRQAAERKQKQ